MEKNALWLFVRRLSLESAIFYLLLLFLPTQLGKHFWPSFSYVLGIRSDFLSPIVYLTDVFVCLLFLFWAIAIAKGFISIKPWRISIRLKYVFPFVFLLFELLFWPGNKFLELYGLVKLGEMVWLAWYVSKNLARKYNFVNVVGVLSISAIIECLLAMLEFVNQHSMDGLWYWLGERHFTPQTIDIADMSLNGDLILRPYATFPHPNVLAGYLLLISTLCLFLFTSLNKKLKYYFLFVYLLSSLVLFLSYGRSSIIGWMAVFVFFLWRQLQNKHKKIILSILGLTAIGIMLLFTLTGNITRFVDLSWQSQAVSQRLKLLFASLFLFYKYPWIGVGWNNFLPSLANLNSYQLNFYSLQPVHNIFVLVLAETGIVGFSVLSLFVYLTSKKIFKNLKHNPNSLLGLLLLLEIAWTGSIDHYWLTLQQGQLFLALTMGIIWSKYTT